MNNPRSNRNRYQRMQVFATTNKRSIAEKVRASHANQIFQSELLYREGVTLLPEESLTYKELVARCANLLPDRVVITGRAWKSLKNCKTNPALLWNAMWTVGTIVCDLLRMHGGVDVQRIVADLTVFKYFPNAGMMTRKNRRLARLYRDSYMGREFNCEAHIGFGNERNEEMSVRIYFCYDDVTNKIIISSIGEHLKNHSTRKIH